MDIGIKFPDYGEEIRKDAEALRMLSSHEQVEQALGMVDFYYSLRAAFGSAEVNDRVAEADEIKGRQAILHMVSRYAR